MVAVNTTFTRVLNLKQNMQQLEENVQRLQENLTQQLEQQLEKQTKVENNGKPAMTKSIRGPFSFKIPFFTICLICL